MIKTDAQSDTSKTFNLGGVIEGESTWEPKREQETSLKGGKTQPSRLKESFVERLYRKLSEIQGQIPEAFHFSTISKSEMEDCTIKAKERP